MQKRMIGFSEFQFPSVPTATETTHVIIFHFVKQDTFYTIRGKSCRKRSSRKKIPEKRSPGKKALENSPW